MLFGYVYKYTHRLIHETIKFGPYKFGTYPIDYYIFLLRPMNAVMDGKLLVHSPICHCTSTYSQHPKYNFYFLHFYSPDPTQQRKLYRYDRAALKPPPHMQFRSELQQANDLLQNAAFFISSKASFVCPCRMRPVYFSVHVCIIIFSLYCANTLPKIRTQAYAENTIARMQRLFF